MNLSWIFPLVYEFGRGVRIFENIAGVRIRTLVYEKKNSACLPKAELKTKTNPHGHHFVAVWVRFGFQLDLLEKKWSAQFGELFRGADDQFCLRR